MGKPIADSASGGGHGLLSGLISCQVFCYGGGHLCVRLGRMNENEGTIPNYDTLIFPSWTLGV